MESKLTLRRLEEKASQHFVSLKPSPILRAIDASFWEQHFQSALAASEQNRAPATDEEGVWVVRITLAPDLCEP